MARESGELARMRREASRRIQQVVELATPASDECGVPGALALRTEIQPHRACVFDHRPVRHRVQITRDQGGRIAGFLLQQFQEFGQLRQSLMARGRGLGGLPTQMRVRDGDASRALKISDPREEREVIVARIADTVVERLGSLGHEAGTPDERCAAVGATAFAFQRAFVTRENCLEFREEIGLHFLEAQQVGGQSIDPLKQTIPACFRMERFGLHPSVALGLDIGLSQNVVAHRSKRGRWCCVIHPASEPPRGHERQDLDPDMRIDEDRVVRRRC